MVLEFTVYHLTPTSGQIADSDGYFEERFGLFSPEQRAAIAAFFVMCGTITYSRSKAKGNSSVPRSYGLMADEKTLDRAA